MNADISLNFIALTESSFSFKIFRRSTEDYQKKDDEYNYPLPYIAGTKDLIDSYIVSFFEKEGFTPYECNSRDNINLTKKWLMDQIKSIVAKKFASDEYIIGRRFIPNISFIVQRFTEGEQIVAIEPYYLQSKQQFGFLLDFRFKAKQEYKFTQRARILSLSLNQRGEKNRNFYVDKYNYIMQYFNSKIVKIFPMSIAGYTIDVYRQLTAIESFVLKEKTYDFGNGTHAVQFQGLKQYGPLEKINKKTLFVFIFEKSRINAARELVRALRGDTYNTFPGMKKLFDVDMSNDCIKSIQVDSLTPKNIKNIESELDILVTENPDTSIVGVFSGISRDFDTGSDFSPYYTLKQMFLKRGIGLQAITIEQMQKSDGLKWSIAGIGLQIFVKLGGKPWRVVPQNDNCIIFGIGNAHVYDQEDHIKKYFAYSVCFDSSGIYKKLDVLSTSTNRKTYIEQLSQQIKSQLGEKLTDRITKCAIHIPHKITREEMRCIKNSVNSLKDTHKKIEFVFIKINTENKYFGYASTNSMVPVAGTYIMLSEREFLVWFEGLQQGKEQVVMAQSIANPVHISFEDSDYLSTNDIKSYLQDVLNLSGANWRGFNAKHSPVSIYYPELIARFAGFFEQYHLPFAFDEHVMDKAWFV